MHPSKASLFVLAFQSLLDDVGLAEVSAIAEKVLAAVNSGHYKEATELWSEAESIVEKVKPGCCCGCRAHGL